MKFLPVITLLFSTSISLNAQEEFVPPQAKLLTQFKFTQLTGGIIIIKAAVDDFKDSLNFVLDTGSGGISFDSATVAYLGLPKQMSERTIRGIAGVKQVEFAYNHTLRLPGLIVDKLDFHINDYDLLTSVYGLKIDGIIGYSFLRRYIVAINYDIQVIEVYTPGMYKYPKGGYMLRPDFSTLPLQSAFIRDAKKVNGRFIFDTGAGLNLLLSENFVTDSSIFRKKRRFFPTQAEGLGGKKKMQISLLKEIDIGPYKFKKVPVHIFDDEFNVTSYPLLGGLIGNDIMRRFNIVLNYPEKSIFIKPNEKFSDPFDYAYTGLGMYLIDGEIRVVDIIEGSPGDKAGFMPGDVIFSVENDISRNIQAYKNLFQNAGGRVTVIVFRDRQPVELVMHIKDIRRN